MEREPAKDLEEEKRELLSRFSDDELLMYHDILEKSSVLVSNPITIIEIRSEVGTDGKQE